MTYHEVDTGQGLRKLRTGQGLCNEHPDRERYKERWHNLRVIHSGLPEMIRHAPDFLAPDELEKGKNYAERGGCPDAAKLTGTYYTSLVLRNEPVNTLPDEMTESGANGESLIDSITTKGEPLADAVRTIVESGAKMGGVGVLLVWGKNETFWPKWRLFQVEDVIEMMMHTPASGIVERPWVVALNHIETIQDGEAWREVVQRTTYTMLPYAIEGGYALHRRVETLDEWGNIAVPKGEDREPPELVLFSGQPVNFIPFTMINFNGDRYGFSESPTEAVAGYQAQYYRVDVILHEVLYFAGFMQFIATGWNAKDLGIHSDKSSGAFEISSSMAVNPGVESGRNVPKFRVGASKAMVTPQADAKAYWAQVDAGSCSQLFQTQNDLMALIANAGAIALQGDGQAKTATEVRREGGGTLSTLAQFAAYAGRDITQLLVWQAQLKGVPTTWKDEKTAVDMKLGVKFNSKYATIEPSPELMKEMAAMAERKVITKKAVFQHLATAGLTPPGQTYEEEQEAVIKDPLVTMEEVEKAPEDKS